MEIYTSFEWLLASQRSIWSGIIQCLTWRVISISEREGSQWILSRYVGYAFGTQPEKVDEYSGEQGRRSIKLPGGYRGVAHV